MKSVNLKQCKITGGFFGERQEINSTETVNAVYDRFKETGRVDALKCKRTEIKPHIFWDSDMAKWLEAAAYILCDRPDAALRKKFDDAVDDIVNNQLESGYFNSYFQVCEPENIFTRRADHELYCAGHFFEAAVAAKIYLDDDRLLKFSEKYADYVIDRFTVKKDTAFFTPGHEEIELALFKLYDLTGKEKYRRLAEFFLETRGREKDYTSEQSQSHLPVREQKTAVGHAVRALYLYSAMADYALLTGDNELIATLSSLADDILESKSFITGGVGNCYGSERFAGSFDLPNERSYAETCASIALALFADRMTRLTGDKKYGDAFERVLYNGILSGESLSGKEFFYTNPLEIYADKIIENNSQSEGYAKDRLPLLRRVKVFACSCCPPNICRFIAELGGYIYYLSESGLTVSQYITSSLDAGKIKAQMTSDFPYSGKVKLKVNSSGEKIKIKLRKPYWSDKTFESEENGYLVYEGVFNGEEITVDFGMKAKRVYSNTRVYYDAGKVALTYGPIVFCAEGADNKDLPALFAGKGGVKVTVCRNENIPLKAQMSGYKSISGKSLYSFDKPRTEKTTINLIPYFAWANREQSDMKVWLIEK
ncbi:MAG: glycoside hydrolase family 127 protein [Clostridia bacterium]|nr:glycoside hydrolase family 127 protein [Clostridia bacterium]